MITAPRRLMLLLALALVASPLVPAPPTPALARPNIVLILADDQRWDTLWSMPTVRSQLVDQGVRFNNAFVPTPMCCPSRASILTGRYAHSTGVWANSGPLGGFEAFDDESTVATWLHDAGYRTALIGKYLNRYRSLYVPPGWDRWFATHGGHGYYKYTANSDGLETTYGTAPSDYSTDVLASEAEAFIRGTDPDQPLFLYFTPHAPHGPATPAYRHSLAFSDLERWRPPSFNENAIWDKPRWLHHVKALRTGERKELDAFRVDQYRSLLAVDEALGRILATLADTGRLSNTMVVFSSDNGFLWGEHRLVGKTAPYGESIRVPYVVRFDPLVPEARRDGHLVLNIDLAPTFAQVAGVSAPAVDGASLVPILSGQAPPWRERFPVEHAQPQRAGQPAYCGVRDERYLYVRWKTGEEEMYDLWADPYELQNRAESLRYWYVRRDMRRSARLMCRPRPPGFRFTH